MKKLFVILLAVATISMLFSSCKKDNGNSGNNNNLNGNLIGSWQVTSVEIGGENPVIMEGETLPVTITFTFKEGGSGSMSVSTGDFTLTEGNLAWAYTNLLKKDLNIVLDDSLLESLKVIGDIAEFDILSSIPPTVEITKLTDTEFWCKSLPDHTSEVELKMIRK